MLIPPYTADSEAVRASSRCLVIAGDPVEPPRLELNRHAAQRRKRCGPAGQARSPGQPRAGANLYIPLRDLMWAYRGVLVHEELGVKMESCLVCFRSKIEKRGESDSNIMFTTCIYPPQTAAGGSLPPSS